MLLACFVLLLGLSGLPTVALRAQNQPDLPAYWQYATSGGLTNLQAGDIDRDGVDELVIADDNNRIDLIDAAGRQIWSHTVPDRVTALAALTPGGHPQAQAGIVVGVPNQIIMLAADGEERWRTEINPTDTPTTLRGSGSKAADSQLEEYEFLPIQIVPFDEDSDGIPEILVLLQSGELLLFDNEGTEIWQHTEHPSESAGNPPQLLLTDLDQDGQDEIVLAIFDPRRFGQLVLIDDGRVVWDLSLSRQITDLAQLRPDDSQTLLAVSTSQGHIYTYDYQRQRRWLRTVNTPVTSLATIVRPTFEALAAGTETGTVIAFDAAGRRLWESQLGATPEHAILALSAAPAGLNGGQPLLAAVVEEDVTDPDSALAYLLDSQGQAVSRISNVDTRGLTQYRDSNRDGSGELVVAHFATLEMLGMGVGNSGNVQEWEYSLNAAPAASLVADLDGDGNEVLIVGTQDGRIHNLNSDRSLRWLHDVGGTISHLTTLPHSDDTGLDLVIAGVDPSGPADGSSWIQLREPKGERLWERRLNRPPSALLAADILPQSGSEVVVGNEDGEVVIFSSSGESLRRIRVAASGNGIENLIHQEVSPGTPAGEIVVSFGNSILAIDPSDTVQPVRRITMSNSHVLGLFPGPQNGSDELGIWLLAQTADGQMHGFNWRGVEMAQWQWPYALGGNPEAVATSTGEAFAGLAPEVNFLMGTASGQLSRLQFTDNRPFTPWRFAELGEITAVHWHDQDIDGQPDLALAGNREGEVTIIADADSDAPQPVTAPIELSSAVSDLATMRRGVGQSPDIVAVTENGLVQMFRDQENRPPLLTNPRVDSDAGQYSVSVNVNDVERDRVVVALEVLDQETAEWRGQGTQQLSDGRGSVFWALPAPETAPDGFHYRFNFSDGSYRGSMTPPPAPAAAVASPWRGAVPFVLAGALSVGLAAFFLVTRQSRTLSARANRFYQGLRQDPQNQLAQFERQAKAGDLQELMPLVASYARQDDARIRANLAEGLFLIADQPQSGLPIVRSAIHELAKTGSLDGEDLARWQILFGTSQGLLDAPTITELSLLQPRLEHLIVYFEERGRRAPELALLRPILSNLRDSERVTQAEDRLVYLNEATNLIGRAQRQLPVFSPSLEKSLTAVILRRWSGLVSAEIEDLLGRAEMVVQLKTRRLIPSAETALVFEIANNGRSAAEDIRITLDEDPAYEVLDPPQTISILSPGRSRDVQLAIAPRVTERFRISIKLHYSDRNAAGRMLAFGDMVHVLQPARDFQPIPNPYTPGTPLRPNSTIFFGRDDLFDFVAENAGRRSYRNVLILVGQRRTGKTSALLRLEDNLPTDLLPVYIDCQSLGVVPGMPALLEELSWYIADALGRKGIEITVPDLAEWQRDPTHLFQRRFLPEVNALLPEDTTLLLVFDEFEAFESLVADGILPPTFFSYLRHLMQHGEQLNFIFVGTRRLEEMTADYWSVLFNIALYRKIVYLDPESATQLITRPVAPNIVYDDLALDKILRVTAGHPYFLQLVCYTLVKQANTQRKGYVTISDVNAALEEMLSLGEVHFAYLWQRSNLAERAILTAVAHLMDQNLPFGPEDVIAELEPYDIQMEPLAITAALNHLVERDILREVTVEARTQYELKLGLVSLWVARNKSLSKLFATPAESDGATAARPYEIPPAGA